MRLAVLAASGATGRQLLTQAVERGHEVTALVRNPARLRAAVGDPGVRVVQVDLSRRDGVVAALDGMEVVVSGLGIARGELPGVLTDGARAVVVATQTRVVWLGALGTGGSAVAVGPLTRGILAVALRAELADKVAADHAVLAAGGTVFHAGPLWDGPAKPGWYSLPLAEQPFRLFPRFVSRSTVAALMLDEAEDQRHRNQIVIPMPGPRRSRAAACCAGTDGRFNLLGPAL